MIDTHIHIGQFYETYYDPLTIMEIVADTGVGELVYSSTTSCEANIQYTEVEKEIASVCTRCLSEKACPLFWYVPEYEAQGVRIEKAMRALPYAGFKIHPRANNWNLEDNKTLDTLQTIFGFAYDHTLPVLIHTGYDLLDEANKFSRFFDEYPRVKCILAHCRPIEQTLNLLKEHENVYCDTAFVPDESIRQIVDAGFSNKIMLGSDFPVTSYFNDKADLRTQYKTDVQRLKACSEMICHERTPTVPTNGLDG